jgi:hypothetical protein
MSRRRRHLSNWGRALGSAADGDPTDQFCHGPRYDGPDDWTLHKNGKQVDCELVFRGESYGWEATFLHNGEFAYGQRFVLRALALEEADVQRRRLLNEGWATPD